MSTLPVIAGVAQSLRHPSHDAEVAELSEPVDMMCEVVAAALQDSGAARRLAKRVTSVRVVAPLSWGYANPAATVARRLGFPACETVLSSVGGNSPQMLVDDACKAIADGEQEVVVIVGAEANYTRRLARRRGERLRWTPREHEDAVPPRVIGTDRPGIHEAELARSLALPVNVYPVFENALRAASGEGIEEHQARIARLWASFSEVASRNPYAWSRERLGAEEIAAPSPANRWISFPYTLRMTANIQTDQAAALVLCSKAAAQEAGVPSDLLVFPLAGAEATDHWFVSERADLHSSPAIRAAGRATLELAGRTIDDVAHVDLYSCFPSAVEIAAAELGLSTEDASRPLTVTGGLSFAGGPGNNYSTHAIASMVDRLRHDAGSLGLVTALGWFITKHAIGLYSTVPPPAYRCESRQAEVDALLSREVVDEYEGRVSVESYTVSFERDGTPAAAILSCLLPDGRRAWGRIEDPTVSSQLTKEDPIGRQARLSRDGRLELL